MEKFNSDFVKKIASENWWRRRLKSHIWRKKTMNFRTKEKFWNLLKAIKNFKLVDLTPLRKAVTLL